MYRLLLAIEDWYSREDNNAFLTIQDFQAFFHTQYPALKKADVAYYESIFDKMEKVDISEAVLEEVLEDHRKRAIASQVADLAWGVANGEREFLELPAALQTLSEEHYQICEPQIEFVDFDLEVLYNKTYGLPGLKWKLKSLCKMMGSLRKGDAGALFARPEVGKTTFLADQCGHMVFQTEAPILHFNNEELGDKIAVRYQQAILGMSTRELFSDRSGNYKKYLEKTDNRIKLLLDEHTHKTFIEDVCSKLNPGLIIIDSLDKVSGFEKEEGVEKFKQIYRWQRNLSKSFAPVVGVCHASASGEGKKYLEMDDVADAKTAKQAELDWLLGIGKTHDPSEERRRFLHLCKNKLIGDEDLDEELRHGRLPVRLFADIAQYGDELDFNE